MSRPGFRRRTALTAEGRASGSTWVAHPLVTALWPLAVRCLGGASVRRWAVRFPVSGVGLVASADTVAGIPLGIAAAVALLGYRSRVRGPPAVVIVLVLEPSLRLRDRPRAHLLPELRKVIDVAAGAGGKLALDGAGDFLRDQTLIANACPWLFTSIEVSPCPINRLFENRRAMASVHGAPGFLPSSCSECFCAAGIAVAVRRQRSRQVS